MTADRIAYATMAAGILLCAFALGLALLQRHSTPTPRVHVGATETWSPVAHVAQADTPEAILSRDLDLARAELADAQASLQPLLDEFHAALGRAFADMDAALAPAMRTARLWHSADHAWCVKCAEQHDETFGPTSADREHTYIRAFRIDTPTGEFPRVGALT